MLSAAASPDLTDRYLLGEIRTEGLAGARGPGALPVAGLDVAFYALAPRAILRQTQDGGTVMLKRSLMVFLIAVSPVNAQAA